MAFQEMLYQVKVFCVSDIGLIRQNNEDAWKLSKEAHFFALADGMGGHQAGEVASKLAVEQLCALFTQKLNSSTQDIAETAEFIKEIIKDVNLTIYRKAREKAELRGMGTTLCCIYIHPEGIIYGHVGDSRIYRFRQGKLKQLTQDHSLLRELIDLGQLTEQQADDFLYKNIITRAMGTEHSVDPTVAYSPLEVGDTYLMCTDGLTDLFSHEEIQNTLEQNSTEEATQLLVAKAKQNGGYDNITVILVQIREKYEANLSGS